MKLMLLTLLTLLPGAAAAQEFFTGDDVLRLYARPFRDRAVRFQSARADALQMRLATYDESDRLTLENWGDNRADLRAGESRLKIDAGAAGGESYSGSRWEDAGTGAGVYGRFGRFEFEASAVAQNSQKENTTIRDEYNKASGGAAFAAGGDGLSFGVHANVNKSGDAGWEEINDNNSAGVALATRNDVYELGLTADFIGRGTRDQSANYDVPRNGPMLGAQALLKPFAGFKAGLRAAVSQLKGPGAHNGGTAYDNYEAGHNEVGARLEWRPEAGPVSLGAEYSRFFYDPSWTQAGVVKKSESEYETKAAGAALRLFGDRVIVSAEARELLLTMRSFSGGTQSGGENEARTLTGGAELWLLPGFALRVSHQKMLMESGGSESESNTSAAGFGFKGETFTLDGSVRSGTQDEAALNPDKHTDVRLTLAWKF